MILSANKKRFTGVRKASWVSTNNYRALSCFVTKDNNMLYNIYDINKLTFTLDLLCKLYRYTTVI